MKNLSLNLVVAFLTFSISISIFSLWNQFYSVDKKLASVITTLETEEIDVRFASCRRSPEECERMKQFIKSQISQWVEDDIENANALCKKEAFRRRM